MGGDGVRAFPIDGPRGSKECGLADGVAGAADTAEAQPPVALVGWTSELGDWLKLSQVAGVPGCPVRELSDEDRRALMVACNDFTLFLWLTELPLDVVDPPDDLDEVESPISTILTAFFQGGYRGPEILVPEMPEGPIEMDTGSLIAALIEATDSALQGATFGLAISPGEST